MSKRSRRSDHTDGASPAAPFSAEPDLEVIVGGQSVFVHSVVLILASPVFKQMLMSEMSERRTGAITLPDKDKDEFLDFVSSLQIVTDKEYTNERAVTLSRWADEYQVDALKTICERHMVDEMPVTIDSFSEDLSHASRYNLPDRVEQCLDAAADDLVKFLDKPENLEVLTSDDAHVKGMWTHICGECDLFSSTNLHEQPPPASQFRCFWPFIRSALLRYEEKDAIKQASKAIKQLPDKLQAKLPSDRQVPAGLKVDLVAKRKLDSLITIPAFERLHEIADPPAAMPAAS